MRVHWRIRRYLELFDINRLREWTIRFWHRAVLARRIRRRGYVRFTALNLGCGSVRLPGYWNIDINIGADLAMALTRMEPPALT